jgi:hypothetical protein
MTDDGDLNGAAHAPAAEAKPAPPVIVELVAACNRFVASKYKVALDGTSDTLSLVDQYVRDARPAVKARPETVDLVAGACGAYLGEVVRQRFGGTWFAEGEYAGFRLYLDHVYLAFNPMGMVAEAVLEGEQPGWHAHLAMDPADREEVEARLASLGPVGEGDYFLPTTRFDVIEIAVEALRARMEARGEGSVTFEPDDYDS